MMQVWLLAERFKSDERAEVRQDEVKRIAKHEASILEFLHGTLPSLFGTRFESLLMSLGAMVFTATSSVKDAWRVAFGEFIPAQGIDIDLGLEASGSLVSKGWCPSDVAHLKTKMLITQYRP
jgi:hypothetical protein